MKILYYTPTYVPNYNAGDTLMAHAIVTYLQSRGHEVTVMIPKGEPYVYDGVNVIPRCSGLFNKVDAVFCQLDTTQETIRLANCPIFWVMHNTFSYPSIEANKHVNVIYNSEAAVNMMGWLNDFFVLPPPVDIDHYNVPRENAEYVTLINCNENKGGKILYEIAKRMPDTKFLAVKGSYGTQYLPIPVTDPQYNVTNKAIEQGLGYLPNVTVIDNMADIREVYNLTKVLIMPSLYESWGRVATEAMASGIPVIAAPTFGLMENIGINGNFVKREDLNGWIMAINKLKEKKEYDKQSAYSKKRAIELKPEKNLMGLESFVSKKVSEHRKKREYGIQQHS